VGPAGSPSSWRKAAWIIVAAASTALIVLVFTAVRMAGPDRRFGRIDAFPGLPTGGLLTPQQPSAGRPAAEATAAATSAAQRTTVPAMPVPGQQQSTVVVPLPGGDRPSEPQPTGRGGGSGPTSGPAAISATTTAPAPTGGGEDLSVVDVTYLFFGFLPDDPASAWELTSARVQQQSYETFRLYWGQYSDIDVQYVTVGADGWTVVATILVTPHKGETTSQRWKLIYQLGQTVVIDQATLLDPGALDPGGNKPFQ